jgi:hypothetical protein
MERRSEEGMGIGAKGDSGRRKKKKKKKKKEWPDEERE